MAEVKPRGGVWYGFAYYYDAERDRRILDRRSTGIKVASAGSKRRAQLAADERERRLCAGLDRVPRTTIAQAFVARAEALAIAGAPKSTRKRSVYSASRLFEALDPDTPIGDLDLASYAAARIAGGASHDTVRRELADLSAACAAAGVPCPTRPKLPRARVVERWLTAEECARLLAQAPPKRARVILLVLQTGLRKNEVWHLVRIAPGVGRLRAQGDGLKTGERTIPLTPEADAILAAGPLDPWVNQGRDLKAYARRAKLGRVTWNDLRATPATLLLLADVAPARIAALLGHSSLRMIERRYARIKNVNVSAADLEALRSLGAVSTVCQNSSPSDLPEPGPAR